MPMRTTPTLAILLGTAVLGVACGSTDSFTAPPPVELGFTVTLDPDASGGMRPSTIVSASLFVDNAVVGGVMQSAEFTAFDAQGGVLARESVAGPLTFGTDGRLTVRQALDWTPRDVLGRSLSVRFVGGWPGATPIVIERTVTF
jgi:hypothetical protein